MNFSIKPQRQEFRHDPIIGIYGDCFRTAIAIVIGMDRDDVPHWHEDMDMFEANRRYDQWLEDRRLSRICIYLSGDLSVDEALAETAHYSKAPFIFSGRSKNGTGHAVVAQDGCIVCDPSIDQSWIVGPMDTEPHKVYLAEWIVQFPTIARSDYEVAP